MARTTHRRSARPLFRAQARAALAAMMLSAALPSWALYKIVGPDGSVTYTDRPPAGTPTGRVTPMGAGAQPRDGEATQTSPDAAAPTGALPFALRQAAARYPVTLYTTAECAPCEAARRWLHERGVPYIERRIETEDDARALDRIVGGRMVPALTVGSKALRGIDTAEWASYVDAAGYPRDARLPAGWKPPEPTPLAARRIDEPAAQEPSSPLTTDRSPTAAPAAPAPVAPAAPPGFRF